MMAVATMTREGLDAAMFYLITYVAMNIGAFGIVAFLRNLTGTEDLSGYRGMIHRAPWLTVALTIFMLSLLGIPPLVGFIGKYQVFAILWQTASAERQTGLYVLLFIGLINTVFSLVYYVRVLKVMIIESPPEDAELSPLRVPPLQHVFAGLLSLVVIAGIAVWDPLAKATSKAVSHFQPVHRAPLVPPPSVPREARQ
jgi:NADH-quinone oxidoreductase subunit N